MTPADDCEERADPQVAAHEAAVLERHAVGGGELQVGDAVGDRGGAAGALGEALAYRSARRTKPARRRAATSSGAPSDAKKRSSS